MQSATEVNVSGGINNFTECHVENYKKTLPSTGYKTTKPVSKRLKLSADMKNEMKTLTCQEVAEVESDDDLDF